MPLIVAGGAVVVAMLYLYGTTQIFVSPFADPAGPRVYPYLLVALMLVGVAVLLVEHWKARRASNSDGFVAKGRNFESTIRWSPLIPVSIWTLIYVTAFEWVGYPMATSIYLLVLMKVFNPGKAGINLVVAVGFAASSYVLLAMLLGAQLPLGRPILSLISMLRS